jgi:hypothetical protein
MSAAETGSSRVAEADRPRQVSRDTSAWSLVTANVFALAVALISGWDLVDLMAVYWLQSIVIGVSYFMRIMSLEKFSTENFRINDQPVDPTPETKRKTAFFFLLHFGGFHAAYLVFILTETPGGFVPGFGFLVCAVAFAFNHAFSYRHNREADRRGQPNIGTMMFTPYLRVIPMHLTIVFGAVAMGTSGVLLFGLLKLAADVVMHHVEHRLLARRRPSPDQDLIR